MWIITRKINQYDQDGEYFFAAFITKPTPDKLCQLFYKKSIKDLADNDKDIAIKYIIHMHKGGGRQHKEDEWFYLNEVEEGEEYSNSLRS